MENIEDLTAAQYRTRALDHLDRARRESGVAAEQTQLRTAETYAQLSISAAVSETGTGIALTMLNNKIEDKPEDES